MVILSPWVGVTGLVRTFIVKGKTAYFQVGGGIVYDSDPEKEYQETLDKAKALIEAVSMINTKLETLNPKQIQNTKAKTQNVRFVF